MIEEMLTRVKLHELDRAAALGARVREARMASPAARALRREAPAGRRMLRVVRELYGACEEPGADPALYSRLAWSGVDGD